MTLTQLYRKIGKLQSDAAIVARGLEIADRVADTCGHPGQAAAADRAAFYRDTLQTMFIALHHLEARLPTPELLSQTAYNRALMLGLTIDAAEAERARTYRGTFAAQYHRHAA